jgi:hypothetical protein
MVARRNSVGAAISTANAKWGMTLPMRIVIASEAKDLFFSATSEQKIPRAENGRSA